MKRTGVVAAPHFPLFVLHILSHHQRPPAIYQRLARLTVSELPGLRHHSRTHFDPHQPRHDAVPMKMAAPISLLLALVIALGGSTDLGFAQVTPVPANPQNPSTQGIQGAADSSAAIGGTGLGTGGTTVSVTPGVGTSQSSSRQGSLRAAGQGLPGMPGGPPLKSAAGSQDPASSYMRPQTIGPLLCDPLLDGLCD